MSILFRTDASPIIGIGHLTRCKALAKSLKKYNFNLLMLGPSEDYIEKEDKNIFTSWEEKKFTTEIDDFNYLIKFAKKNKVKIIILDDYRIKNIYQYQLSKTDLKIVQFESRYQFNIYADLIINSTIGANLKNYKNLINNKSKLLLGPKYATLREEFLLLNRLDRCNKNLLLKKIYINFGGGDDKGAIQKILTYLSNIKQLEFTIVSGKKNPRNQTNLNFINNCLNKSKISYLISPDQVSKIINSCDLAILAGGTSTFEASFCGLPMIIIPIANNQLIHAEDWVSTGAAFYLSNYENLNKDYLIKTISNIFKEKIYRRMSNASSKIVDGLGTYRVAKYIAELNLFDK